MIVYNQMKHARKPQLFTKVKKHQPLSSFQLPFKLRHILRLLDLRGDLFITDAKRNIAS